MKPEDTSRPARAAFFLLLAAMIIFLILDGPWKDWEKDQTPPEGDAGAPRLEQPYQNEYIHDTNVTFAWSPAVGQGGHYIFELAENDGNGFAYPLATFNDLSANSLTLGNLSLEQIGENTLPELGGSYIWRVKWVYASGEETGWSGTGEFNTGTTKHLGITLLEDWGPVLFMLSGVLLATMVAGVFLAKEEDAQPINPEYMASEVMTAPAPGEPGYEARSPPPVEGGP